MDLDKPSVWGSLKQKTRPFLQNLSVRKTKKRSSKMMKRTVSSLDRCLSVSVPDMLEVDTLTEEETTYSSTQVLSSSSPKSFSRSMMSLKSRSASARAVGEDWPWVSQQVTRTEATVTSPDVQAAGSSMSEGKRKSSDDLFELLQRTRLSPALTDDGAETLSSPVQSSYCEPWEHMVPSVQTAWEPHGCLQCTHQLSSTNSPQGEPRQKLTH